MEIGNTTPDTCAQVSGLLGCPQEVEKRLDYCLQYRLFCFHTTEDQEFIFVLKFPSSGHYRFVITRQTQSNHAEVSQLLGYVVGSSQRELPYVERHLLCWLGYSISSSYLLAGWSCTTQEKERPDFQILTHENESACDLCPFPDSQGIYLTNIQGLKHVTYEELREWGLLVLRKAQRGANCCLHCLMGSSREEKSRLFSEVQSKRSGDNSHKLQHRKFPLENIFTIRVVKPWNRLPREMAETTSSEIFIK